MKKTFILCLAIFFSLAGCQKTATITIDDVLSAFEQQGQHLEKSKAMKNDTIFGAKLYGEKPKVYLLDQKLLYLFVYDSNADRVEALQQFQEKTALMNSVSFSVYEKDNMLIFYVYEDAIENIEVDASIKEALNGL